MPRTIACCVTALALIASAFGQTAATGTVAYVFEVEGHWRTGPQFAVDLVRGAALRNHDVVALRGEPGRSYIHIGMLDGGVKIRDCRTAPQECTQNLQIDLTTGDRSLSGRLRDIWNRLTISDSPSPVFTMSRGRRLRDDPQEAVLPRNGENPDFASALTSVAAGIFDAELTPLAAGPTVRVTVDWSRPQAKSSGPPIKIGLYRLKLIAGGAESGTVTVLVVPSNQAVSLRDDFAAAAAIAQSWPESMASARHEYLAAVLAQLAERIPTAR